LQSRLLADEEIASSACGLLAMTLISRDAGSHLASLLLYNKPDMESEKQT